MCSSAATPDVNKAAAALNADTTTVPAALKQASKIEVRSVLLSLAWLMYAQDIAGSMDLDLGDF